MPRVMRPSRCGSSRGVCPDSYPEQCGSFPCLSLPCLCVLSARNCGRSPDWKRNANNTRASVHPFVCVWRNVYLSVVSGGEDRSAGSRQVVLQPSHVTEIAKGLYLKVWTGLSLSLRSDHKNRSLSHCPAHTCLSLSVELQLPLQKRLCVY